MTTMRDVSHTHPATEDTNSVWYRGVVPTDD